MQRGRVDSALGVLVGHHIVSGVALGNNNQKPCSERYVKGERRGVVRQIGSPQAGGLCGLPWRCATCSRRWRWTNPEQPERIASDNDKKDKTRMWARSGSVGLRHTQTHSTPCEMPCFLRSQFLRAGLARGGLVALFCLGVHWAFTTASPCRDPFVSRAPWVCRTPTTPSRFLSYPKCSHKPKLGHWRLE